MDANEDIKIGCIAKSFTAIGLIDSITTITSATPPGSHIRGSRQIDGIWVSSDLTVTVASFCPFNFGVGDHRIVLVDLDKATLFRSATSLTFPSKMRRLISSNLSVVSSYLEYAKQKVEDHKILPKLKNLISRWNSLTETDREIILNKIDDQLYQIFIQAEK